MNQLRLSEPAAGTICLACGLCCDGTLFSYVSIGENEFVRLGRRYPRDAEVSSAQEIPYSLPHPCRFHIGGSCTIYDDRPDPCRTYRCALLMRNEDNVTGGDECLHIIETAKAAVASVYDALPPGTTLAEARRLLSSDGAEAVAWRHQYAELAVGFCTLEYYLKKHFRLGRLPQAAENQDQHTEGTQDRRNEDCEQDLRTHR